MLTTDFEFAINMPLLDGRLERRVAPYLERVLDAETAVLTNHVAEQVCAATVLPEWHRGNGYRDEERWQRQSRR